MILKHNDMLFSEFMDHLSTLDDDPDLAEAWIESLPTRDRDRMFRTFLTFEKACNGSRLALWQVAVIAWQEDRVLRRRAAHRGQP